MCPDTLLLYGLCPRYAYVAVCSRSGPFLDRVEAELSGLWASGCEKVSSRTKHGIPDGHYHASRATAGDYASGDTGPPYPNPTLMRSSSHPASGVILLFYCMTWLGIIVDCCC